MSDLDNDSVLEWDEGEVAKNDERYFNIYSNTGDDSDEKLTKSLEGSILWYCHVIKSMNPDYVFFDERRDSTTVKINKVARGAIDRAEHEKYDGKLSDDDVDQIKKDANALRTAGGKFMKLTRNPLHHVSIKVSAMTYWKMLPSKDKMGNPYKMLGYYEDTLMWMCVLYEDAPKFKPPKWRKLPIQKLVNMTEELMDKLIDEIKKHKRKRVPSPKDTKSLKQMLLMTAMQTAKKPEDLEKASGFIAMKFAELYLASKGIPAWITIALDMENRFDIARRNGKPVLSLRFRIEEDVNKKLNGDEYDFNPRKQKKLMANLRRHMGIRKKQKRGRKRKLQLKDVRDLLPEKKRIKLQNINREKKEQRKVKQERMRQEIMKQEKIKKEKMEQERPGRLALRKESLKFKPRCLLFRKSK